jgi:hypothetical protein
LNNIKNGSFSKDQHLFFEHRGPTSDNFRIQI